MACAALAQPWAADSFARPSRAVSVVRVDETKAIFQPFFAVPVTPTVISPSVLCRPPKTCLKLTLWAWLNGSRVSPARTREAVERSWKSALLRSSHLRAAKAAFLPRIPLARYLPRLESVAGVPYWFQVTLARNFLTAARCAPVGATAPDLTSKSARPSLCSWIFATPNAEAGKASAPRAATSTTHLRSELRIPSPIVLKAPFSTAQSDRAKRDLQSSIEKSQA